MKSFIGALLFAATLAFAVPEAYAEQIISARYEMPVERYGHFALGRPHEYARLAVTTDSRRDVSLQLADEDVIEDLVPRLVRLTKDAPPEILAIVSRRGAGSRLVLYRLLGGRLEVSAQSAPIGTPMRWMNPVGAADLDGDGNAEITAITTPHIGGTLRVYRRSGDALLEIASLAGFSNHIYGSPNLALSATVSIAGRMHLIAPDTRRTQLRIVALRGGKLVEMGRCDLPSPVTGTLAASAASGISVMLQSGVHAMALSQCGVQ